MEIRWRAIFFNIAIFCVTIAINCIRTFSDQVYTIPKVLSYVPGTTLRVYKSKPGGEISMTRHRDWWCDGWYWYTTTFWELWVGLTGCVCRSEVFSELQKQWGTISVLYQLNLDEMRMKIRKSRWDRDDVWWCGMTTLGWLGVLGRFWRVVFVGLWCLVGWKSNGEPFLCYIS